MNTSDVLNKAADLIEQNGWGQGGDTWSGCSGAICIDEALARAQGFVGCNVPPTRGGLWIEDLIETPAAEAVMAYLELQPGPVYIERTDLLYGWNDANGRTAAEVVEVLRACAVIEASRERETAAVS